MQSRSSSPGDTVARRAAIVGSRERATLRWLGFSVFSVLQTSVGALSSVSALRMCDVSDGE